MVLQDGRRGSLPGKYEPQDSDLPVIVAFFTDFTLPQEGHTGVIGFKEESPEAVKAMLHYMYTGSYDCEDANKSEGGQMLA
jgi:hypothetical protein